MQDQQTSQMILQGHQRVGSPSFLPPIHHSAFPFLSLSDPPAFWSFLHFPPLISHVVFLSFLHTLLPQPSLLGQFSPRLGRISISSLLCDFKVLSFPLCAAPTTSRFLCPAGDAWSLGEGVGGGGQGVGERTQHGAGAPHLRFAQGLLPSHKAGQDPCNRKGTDCCCLATGLAPRKPKKALDAEQGWERSRRKKQAAPGEWCPWIWGTSGKKGGVRLSGCHDNQRQGFLPHAFSWVLAGCGPESLLNK